MVALLFCYSAVSLQAEQLHNPNAREGSPQANRAGAGTATSSLTNSSAAGTDASSNSNGSGLVNSLPPGASAADSALAPKSKSSSQLLYAQNGDLFKHVVQANMQKWDLNQDGKLDISEINKAIFDPSNTGDAACALAAIHGAQRKASKSASTTDDASQIDGGIIELLDPSLVRRYGRAFLNAKKKLSRHSQILFASGAPHLESLKQGKTGDCYLISSLGSMAVNRPDELRQLLKESGDGRYEVDFPGHDPIIVEPPTEAEFATFGESGGDGIWLNVFEKAFGRVRMSNAPEQSDTDMYDRISGGKSGTVISLLTGHKVKRYHFKDEKDRGEVRAAIEQALAAHRLMCCGIKTPKPGTTKVSGHALALISFDAAQDQVTLWNPWGTSVFYKDVALKMKNGIFSMPTNDWLARFSSLVVETDQPYIHQSIKR